jgi:ABC-type glycerol-3-phosphate transport system permease component
LTAAPTRRTPPRKTVQTVIYHATMLLIAGIFLLPFYWMTISAFKNNISNDTE